MKKLALLSALAVLFVAAANAQSSGNFQVNGALATTTACLNHCVDGTALLEVASSNQNGQTTWFAFFDVYGHDSQGNLTHIGYAGQIPPGFVSGNGQTSLTLNLDTNAAGLQLQYCVADQFLNWTCSPYSGGIINVSWTPTRVSSQSGTFVNQIKFPAFTIQDTDSGSSSSAVVQASFFGQQYADAGGSQLGSSHTGQIVVTRN
jgi:hypothetical protein